VKRASKKVIERYYQRLTLDFATNKRICDEVAMIPSKRLRNKIAGFTTHMMKRIARGPVKGISLKLQEEEREKRLDYIPDISAVDLEIEKGIEIDKDTKDMLRAMDMGQLPGLNVVMHKDRRPYGDRPPPRGDRPPRN
jgi:small subunit ribosomal protein S17e